MLIRKANQSDCKAIFDWRNDPHSREMSFDNREISYNDHVNWFEQSINNPLRELYIGQLEQEKIGVCRFDYNEETLSAEVSVNMNPRMRNKGLGKDFLVAAISLYESAKETVLSARIKTENEASKRMFTHAGFTVARENETDIVVTRPISRISFKKINDHDVDILYELLMHREHSISHMAMPSYESHKDFILSNPYAHWFLVKNCDAVIGAFYIQNDNAIGINIAAPTELIVKKIIAFIEENFVPRAAIASKVPPYFFINVAKSHRLLAGILKQIGCTTIQESFRINDKDIKSV